MLPVEDVDDVDYAMVGGLLDIADDVADTENINRMMI